MIASPATHPKSVGKPVTPSAVPRDFFRLSTWRYVRDAVLLWAGVGGLAFLASMSQSGWTWLGFALLMGVIQNAFGILAHDAIHFRAHPDKKTNDCLARLLVTSAITFPLAAGRANHLNHHQYLGTARDRDRHYYASKGKETPLKLLGFLLGALLLVNLFQIALKILTPTASTTKSQGNEPRYPAILEFLMIATHQLLIGAGLFLLTGHWWAYFALWLLPLYTVSVFLNCVRSFCEHALAVPDAEADRNRLITHISHPLERMLIAPFNMNYHAEHHLYTAVPYYHLPALHTWLQTTMPDNTVRYKHLYLGTVASYMRDITRS